MNLTDILHGLIERVAFNNEDERAAYHSAVDNLYNEESQKASETASGSNDANAPAESTQTVPVEVASSTDTTVTPAADNSEAVNPTPGAAPETAPSETSSDSGSVSGPGSPQGA